jgi:hypothetical protein
MIMLYDNPRLAFWLSPLLLIAFVFAVTLFFSRFMEPLFLTAPLLCAYYGFIWFSIWRYGRNAPKGDALLKKNEFRATFNELSPWMLLWITVYPFAAGIPSFLATAPPVPWGWLLAGILFARGNGPHQRRSRVQAHECHAQIELGIQVRIVDASGKMEAGYFNPRPINVSKAQATKESGKIILEDKDYLLIKSAVEIGRASCRERVYVQV